MPQLAMLTDLTVHACPLPAGMARVVLSDAEIEAIITEAGLTPKKIQDQGNSLPRMKGVIPWSSDPHTVDRYKRKNVDDAVLVLFDLDGNIYIISGTTPEEVKSKLASMVVQIARCVRCSEVCGRYGNYRCVKCYVILCNNCAGKERDEKVRDLRITLQQPVLVRLYCPTSGCNALLDLIECDVPGGVSPTGTGKGYCVTCGALTNQLCKGCRSVSYCSEACQVKGWKEVHKDVCRYNQGKLDYLFFQ